MPGYPVVTPGGWGCLALVFSFPIVVAVPAGQRDDLASDLVLGEAVQRQVPQPGVPGVADMVRTACPPAVPELQIGDLVLPRADGEGGET